jgi:hypothetical protein
VSRGCTFGDTRKGSGGMYLASTNANGNADLDMQTSIVCCLFVFCRKAAK